MIRRMKTYFQKDDMDYTKGYVDPFKYHATFYYFLESFQVGVNRPTGMKAYVNQNLLLLFIGSTCGLISLSSFIHGVNTMDLNLMTEAGTYVIILIYKVMILSRTKLNYEHYQNLLRAMKEDFEYICTNPSAQKYRQKFFEIQLLTWKICIFSIVFEIAIALVMVIFTIVILIFFLANHEPGYGEKRPLLFPFYVKGIDFGVTPIYEIAFVLGDIGVLAYAYNYTFMIQTQIVWIRHITTKVDMITWKIEEILEDIHPTTKREENEHFNAEINYRMRDIIRQHQSMYKLLDDWVTVHKRLLMYEQKFCASVACLSAYCFVEKLDQGELHLIHILLLSATLVLHFITCFLCTFVAHKVNSICDACWNTPFWNASKVIRPYFVIMMQRSMRPLPLQAPGFDDISIQTFSTKMANAYSAFNMLRQIQIKMPEM